MKVLNLQCHHDHAFEGWFASEDAFRDQLLRGLVGCPVCGNTEVVKLPSAPRLNLAAGRSAAVSAGPAETTATATATALTGPAAGHPEVAKLTAAWWRAARKAALAAEDVGPRFAEEARRIHHGEAEERGIRGQASREEVRQLMEEGVGVLPLPDALKETLQ